MPCIYVFMFYIEQFHTWKLNVFNVVHFKGKKAVDVLLGFSCYVKLLLNYCLKGFVLF